MDKQIQSRYIVVKKIGSGSFGKVYEVQDRTDFQKQVKFSLF